MSVWQPTGRASSEVLARTPLRWPSQGQMNVLCKSSIWLGRGNGCLHAQQYRTCRGA